MAVTEHASGSSFIAAIVVAEADLLAQTSAFRYIYLLSALGHTPKSTR